MKNYIDYLTFIPIVVLLVPFDYVTWNIMDYFISVAIGMNFEKQKNPKELLFKKSLHYRSWKDVVTSNWSNHICEI